MKDRITILVLLGALLGGCALALPFPASDSTPAYDLAPYIPAQVLAAANDVLVLTQHSTEKRKGGLWTMDMAEFNTWVTTLKVEARILKASQLTELTQYLKLSAEERIDSISLLSARGTGIFPFLTVSREKLDKLCLLPGDGWVMTFRPAADACDAGARVPYAASHRDAIVAALRAGRDDPFSAAEAPCGIEGLVSWQGDLRSRVIEFLARPM